MVKSKFINVLDDGTDMLFLVTKFEKSDSKMLARKGWKFSDDLCIISAVDNKICSCICSSMSTFKHPSYDIAERSKAMGYSHTTHAVADVIKGTDFDDIPDVVDVSNVQLKL